MSQRDYLLSDSASELERLRLQARVWELETEAWLDRLGPMEGWHCLDLGCGAMGILGPLSRHAGPSGRIVGVDIDTMQLRGARAFVAETPLANVEVLEADAYASPLPAGSFDLTHVRFLFAPVGRDAQLMNELWRLTKPGGIHCDPGAGQCGVAFGGRDTQAASRASDRIPYDTMTYSKDHQSGDAHASRDIHPAPGNPDEPQPPRR